MNTSGTNAITVELAVTSWCVLFKDGNVATFDGPDAEKRAREYASFRYDRQAQDRRK